MMRAAGLRGFWPWFVAAVAAGAALAAGAGGASGGAGVTKETVLKEMRERGILGPEAERWGREDWELLWRIKKAEAEGAVDVLIHRLRHAHPYVAVVKRGEGLQKFLLTPAGYERYRFFKSQDAIRTFESRGIALKEVFHLTDLTGHPFFDAAGLLTPDGEQAYDGLLRGESPQWKFDWEPVPERVLAKEKRGDPPEVAALKMAGLEEISEEEERFLLEATGCSERELQERSSLQAVVDTYRNRPRYFMDPDDPVHLYVTAYRSGERDPRSIGDTPTFGRRRAGLCR